MSPWLLITAGVVVCFLSQLLKVWVRARQFRRLNPLGVQMFRNYTHLLSAQLSEGALGLLSFLLLVAGALAIAAGALTLAGIPLPKVP